MRAAGAIADTSTTCVGIACLGAVRYTVGNSIAEPRLNRGRVRTAGHHDGRAADALRRVPSRSDTAAVNRSDAVIRKSAGTVRSADVANGALKDVAEAKRP